MLSTDTHTSAYCQGRVIWGYSILEEPMTATWASMQHPFDESLKSSSDMNLFHPQLGDFFENWKRPIEETACQSGNVMITIYLAFRLRLNLRISGVCQSPGLWCSCWLLLAGLGSSHGVHPTPSCSGKRKGSSHSHRIQIDGYWWTWKLESIITLVIDKVKFQRSFIFVFNKEKCERLYVQTEFRKFSKNPVIKNRRYHSCYHLCPQSSNSGEVLQFFNTKKLSMFQL